MFSLVTRPRWIALAAIMAIGLALGGWAAVGSAPDATVPSGLQPWVDPARQMARRKAGLADVLPFRFVEARCTRDGRTVALVFESAVISVRTYAAIGFPSESEADSPGAVIGIVGLTEEEFEGPPDFFSTRIVGPCGDFSAMVLATSAPAS